MDYSLHQDSKERCRVAFRQLIYMTDTVTAFPTPAPRSNQPVRETGIALTGTKPGCFSAVGRTSTAAAASAVIPIDKLYPATKESASDLLTALGLLADAHWDIGERRALPLKTRFHDFGPIHAALPSGASCPFLTEGYRRRLCCHYQLLTLRLDR